MIRFLQDMLVISPDKTSDNFFEIYLEYGNENLVLKILSSPETNIFQKKNIIANLFALQQSGLGWKLLENNSDIEIDEVILFSIIDYGFESEKRIPNPALLERFKHSSISWDSSLVRKIIESHNPDFILYNGQLFPEFKVTKEFLENLDSLNSLFDNNCPHIKLSEEVLEWLLKIGQGRNLIKNREKFGIKLDENFVRKLQASSELWLVSEDFEPLSSDFAKELIKKNELSFVLRKIKMFDNFQLDQSIVESILLTDKGEEIIENNLDSFEEGSLSSDLGIKLIKKGAGFRVYLWKDKFSGIDWNAEMGQMLIDNGARRAILYSDSFPEIKIDSAFAIKVIDEGGYGDVISKLDKISDLNPEKAKILFDYLFAKIPDWQCGDIFHSLIVNKKAWSLFLESKPKLTDEQFKTLENLRFSYDAKVNEWLKSYLHDRTIKGRFKIASSAPRSERRKAINNFQEQLIQYYYKWGKLLNLALEHIKTNPEVLEWDFMDYFMSLAFKEGFDPYYKEELKERVAIPDELSKVHEAILNYKKDSGIVARLRKECPNDNDLFATLNGLQPKGKIEIYPCLASIYIRCWDKEDYALIHRKDPTDYNLSLSPEDIEIASRSGGISDYNKKYKISIIAENNDKGLSFDEERPQAVFIHEQQHVLWKYFSNLDLLHSDPDLLEAINLDFNQKRAKGLINKKLNEYSINFFERFVADEISAYVKDGTEKEKIKNILLRTKNDGGLYDYAGTMVKNGTKARQILFRDEHIDKNSEAKINEIIKESVQEIFVKKYREVVQDGIEAMMKLVEMLGADEAIFLLMNKPLRVWPKIVKRTAKR